MKQSSRKRKKLNTVEKKHSEILSDFLMFLRQCENDYRYSYEQVGIEDRKVTDFNHRLEFAIGAAERNMVAKEYQESRLHRRKNKDLNELTEPIHNLMQDTVFQKAVKQMEMALGQIRNTEKYHDNRRYIPRMKGKEGD